MILFLHYLNDRTCSSFLCVISHIFSLLSGLFLEGHKRPWKANRRTILFRAWNDHLLESISFIIGPKFRWNGNLKIRVKSSNPPHLGRRSKIQNEQIELNDKIFRIFIITQNLPSPQPYLIAPFRRSFRSHLKIREFSIGKFWMKKMLRRRFFYDMQNE